MTRSERNTKFNRLTKSEKKAYFAKRMYRTARHEAGHIVAAYAVGLYVETATLTVHHKVYGLGGTTIIGPTFEETDPPERVRCQLIELMAGQTAETLVSDDFDEICRGASGDMSIAWILAARALGPSSTDDEQLALMRSCGLEAGALLTSRRPALRSVARYLLTHVNEDVPGDTLKACIDEAIQ